MQNKNKKFKAGKGTCYADLVIIVTYKLKKLFFINIESIKMKFLKSCLIVALALFVDAKNLNRNQNANTALKTDSFAKTKCDCNENKEKFISSNTGCSSYKMGGCGKATCINSDCNLDIATWKYNWDWEFSSKFFFIIYGSDIGSPSALNAQAKTLNMNVGPSQSLSSVVGPDTPSLDTLGKLAKEVKLSKSSELQTRTPQLTTSGLKFSTTALTTETPILPQTVIASGKP